MGNVAQRHQFGTRTDGADDVFGLVIAAGYVFRQMHGLDVQVLHALGQPKFPQHHLVAAEGVGFNRIRARIKVGPMNIPDPIGSAFVQQLHAALEPHPPKILLRGISGQDLRSHASIQQQHPFFEMGG